MVSASFQTLVEGVRKSLQVRTRLSCSAVMDARAQSGEMQMDRAEELEQLLACWRCWFVAVKNDGRCSQAFLAAALMGLRCCAASGATAVRSAAPPRAPR